MPMPEVAADCSREADGWSCVVTVGNDPAATVHHVTVSHATLAQLAPRASDPTALVAESFRFLLEREARESILRNFDLPLIGRYFPEYPDEIQDRLGQ
jgi:hypothetical protein